MTRLIFALVFRIGLWATEDPYAAARDNMVREQIEPRGVRNPDVLRVLRSTPRHMFMPEAMWDQAYSDRPLPIGHGQTISQPYIVAVMTELLEPARTQRVLEIGTGSGYQAAVLSQLVKEVYSIEIVSELAKSSSALLGARGYRNVTVREGDGYSGWPEKAPFDRIILTAAPPDIPTALIHQLRAGGKLVAPIGGRFFGQDLVVLNKAPDGKTSRRSVIPVTFVPMVSGSGKQ